MNDDIAMIVSRYEATGSLKRTALELRCSQQRVRKALITAGVYESPASREANKLREQGLTIMQIAEVMGMGRSAVCAYLPYVKGIYKKQIPSENALNIRRCRSKARLSV